MKQILFFSASWCVPCQALKKTIAALDESERSQFEWVNVDIEDEDNKQTVESYSVMSVPTLVLLSDGIEKRRKVGNLSLSYLRDFLFED